MKLYINDSLNPYYNLAAEEYLLDHTEEDIILLWRNAPAVIIGKNQNAFTEVNFDFVHAHDIAVVRRLTGGGAVFHDPGNINFTFISPRGGTLAEGIREGGLDFAHFTSPIIDALRGLGVDAALSGRNDIIVHTGDGERKISGNAQCVHNDVTMHHGTLLFMAQLERMQGALNVDPTKLKSKGIASVKSRVANLYALLEPSVQERMPDAQAFMAYLADNLSGRFGAAAEPFTDAMRTGIQALADSKYSTDEWNLRRFGCFETLCRKRFPFGLVEAQLTVRDGRIAELRFMGDFFGERDAQELSKQLQGAAFSREAVCERLAQIPVNAYISGADSVTICSLLFENNDVL